jgi:hypothetical protein
VQHHRISAAQEVRHASTIPDARHSPPGGQPAAYEKDVDRTLIRENRRCSVEERFLRLIALQRFAEELRRAGPEAERSG